MTLEGDANGAPHPDASSYAKKFSGKYTHRVVDGGIGHNLPQEAPEAFAQAVLTQLTNPRRSRRIQTTTTSKSGIKKNDNRQLIRPSELSSTVQDYSLE